MGHPQADKQICKECRSGSSHCSVHESLKFLEQYVSVHLSGIPPYLTAVAVDYESWRCLYAFRIGGILVLIDVELINLRAVSDKLPDLSHDGHHLLAVGTPGGIEFNHNEGGGID